MKKAALLFVLLFAGLAPAAQNADEYSINVNVSSARTSLVPNASGNLQQQLDVTIKSKKYELSALSDGSLLALGDYKAKLVRDDHKTAYESFQVYEILLPDKKTATYNVTAQCLLNCAF
jgi:hypothetical protein